MSPRGVRLSRRQALFEAATAGDPWWDQEEQALVEMVQSRLREAATAAASRETRWHMTPDGHAQAGGMFIGDEQQHIGSEIIATLIPGLLHLNSLPPGWRVIVADQEYVPKPARRQTLRQRLAAWLRRRWALA